MVAITAMMLLMIATCMAQVITAPVHGTYEYVAFAFIAIIAIVIINVPLTFTGFLLYRTIVCISCEASHEQ